MGMGEYIPRIVSPMTGEQQAKPSLGNTFPTDEKNMARWRQWWKVGNQEQAITFWAIGTAGIVVLSVLAYSTVFGKDTGEDFDFIQLEGETLKTVVAPWFGTVFWLVGFFKLLSTMLGNFDYVSRITADAVKINAAPENEFWSESRIYAATVWALIVGGRGDPPDLHGPAARPAGDRLRAQRDRDVHLLDPPDHHEPRCAAARDQAGRLPAGGDVLRRRLVRLLLDARGHRVRRAAVLMAGSRALRLRVLLALTIWLALIALVKLVEAL